MQFYHFQSNFEQIIVLLLSVFLTTNIYAVNITEVKTLYADLMNGYNKDIRPVTEQTDTLNVNVSLIVYSLQEFNEVEEKFSVVGVFYVQWKDEILVWDTTNYSHISHLFVRYDAVWIPEIILVNPSQKIASFGEDWQLIRYTSNGNAYWYPGDLIKATCSVDVYYYPFDIHDCEILVYTWGYSAAEVSLHATRNTIDTSAMTEHGSWTLISTSADVVISSGSTMARFRLRLERKPAYVLINVIFPILFLCLLNSMVFVLPAESGERISYSVTVLLAVAVYMTIVSDNLPKLSKPVPVVSYLLLSNLIVSAIITVVSILNLRLFHNADDSLVPAWLIRVNKTLNFSCIGAGKGKTEEDDSTGNDKNIVKFVDTHLRPNNKTAPLSQDKHERTQDAANGMAWCDSADRSLITWHHISRMIDKISVIVSTTIILASFILFFIFTKTSAK